MNQPPNFKGYKVPRLLPVHYFAVAVFLILLLGSKETGRFMLTEGGVILGVAGSGIVLWCVVHFHRAKTAILPGAQPKKLITSGPFRFSRNPIYGGMVVILAALWSFTGGFSPFAVLIVFITIIHNRYILMEEQHMMKEFGEDYLRYCMSTRRWL